MTTDIINYHNYRGSRGRSWNGSSQRPISAKIDNWLWDEVQKEKAATGTPANTLINLALRWYLAELDEARRARAQGRHFQNLDGGTPENALKYTLKELTIEEADKLRFICKGLGLPLQDIPLHMVRKLLNNYDKRPFDFI